MTAIVPAFGQRLMKRRFAGVHPLFVVLTIGEDWALFSQEPFVGEYAFVALKPRDARKPQELDLRCLTGTAVTVIDQEGAAGERAAPIGSPPEAERAPFFTLLHHIALQSGPLDFVTSAAIYDTRERLRGQHQVNAALYAYECKLADPARAWPWWWPESLDKVHAEKIAAWCAAARFRARSARAAIGRAA